MCLGPTTTLIRAWASYLSLKVYSNKYICGFDWLYSHLIDHKKNN